MPLVSNQSLFPASISAGGSLTGLVGIAPYTLVGIVTDANWTAQAISLKTSIDGTTVLPLQNQAASLSFGTLAASTFMALDPTTLKGVQMIEVQSGAAGSGVNQTNNTTLTLVCQSIL